MHQKALVLQCILAQEVIVIAGKELMTEETIEHMASVVEAKGTDAFWQAPIEELLPESLRGEAPKLEKRLETMDVWFDSGTSWAGCVEGTGGLSFPANLYLEVSRVANTENWVSPYPALQPVSEHTVMYDFQRLESCCNGIR